ncbi:MAG: TIGR04283 family arsenosugar biosynthesis glycosyltransferase [Ginsengibacter sp.]
MEEYEIISIIIPAYNEEECIGKLIRYLKLLTPGNAQIIVSDGGSTDNTQKIATGEGAMVVTGKTRGRAAQMNYGASFASGSILYFIHADCLPSESFYNKIIQTIREGSVLGRFQTRFDSKSMLLKINSFFTRFDWFMCYGGDQTFFIKKTVFKKLNGFREDMQIMEDYEIVRRARTHYRYTVLSEKVLISARKYRNNSWIKVQLANRMIVKMYRNGARQETLIEKYKQLIDYR